MKRLALFLDGTWNEPDDRTNVSRLRDLTIDDGNQQIVRYVEGVGNRWTERIRGGAFGRGLSRNLRDGYGWLADNFEDGDHIYLFGFSRGAYTARTVAGMIARCGLLRADATMTVDEIFDRYRRGSAYGRPGARPAGHARHEPRLQTEVSQALCGWASGGDLGREPL